MAETLVSNCQHKNNEIHQLLLTNAVIFPLRSETFQTTHASVRGDAAKLIRGLSITVDNLNNCWDILCSRVFFEREARGLNELKFVKPDIKKGSVKPLNSFNKSNVNTTVVKCNQVKSDVKPDVVKGNNCILCDQIHALFKCPTFNSMNVSERWQVAQNNNLFANCLRSKLRLDTCRIGFSCKNSSERHHTLLHIYSVSPSADTQANSVVTVSNNCTQSAEGHVLLSTALINIKSKHGQQITCRALIDNASQNSLISKQCADRLKLPLKHTNHKLVGVNETFAETSLYSTNFEFSSCVSSDKFQVKALLVSKVTSAISN
ncbi:hypothetical protein TNCV_2321371 [Trichonephila clavipes]|nr:hypothetical protein TNCV_2321371 [Trichonephila clavipes]